MSEHAARSSVDELFPGGDPTATTHRQLDWASTPLGPVSTWPEELRAALRTVIPSRIPMLLWWGPEHVQLYNDAYAGVIGDKHPAGIGQAAVECWAEAWGDLGPLAEAAWSGAATHSEDLRLLVRRHGYLEETWWTFSVSPVRDAAGTVRGLLVTTSETTQVVVRGARLAILGRLGSVHHGADPSVEEVLHQAIAILEEAPREVRSPVAHLVDDGDPAPAGEVRREEGPDGVVLHLPITDRGQDRVIGTLSLGLDPHRPDDASYRTFLDLVGRHVSTAVTDAGARAAEQRQAEALADLDRAKTRFLQNASHELRTPLALLTGAHSALLDRGDLDVEARREVEVAERATLRLRRLVDGLLDVARAEEGQIEARPVPTDLGRLTDEVASMFRSAIEAAGLALDVRIDDLPAAVEIDPEMWSRIVSNLVSNAYKFTTAGSITVELTPLDGHIALVVSDTGAGIRAAELPRLFARFHQIPGTSSRTAEGAGIGLALVRDLVSALDGTVTVESALGSGSRFTVTIPHLATSAAAEAVGSALEQARPLAVEAATWSGGADGPEGAAPEPDGDRILVVEDNPDLRAHLVRLLEADGWAVEAVGDVPSALTHPTPPLLILSDVMLPGPDGIDLLHIVRTHPDLAEVPVILLTARAGPEAAAEGLAAGANDHLAKPFDPAELLARVRTHAELHRRRRTALADGDRADHLEVALQSSRRIGAAIGILMHRLRITEDEAFQRLRKASQDGNRKLRDVAEEIVLTGSVPRD